MPQFDFLNFSSQIFWLLITFSFLYLFLSRVALSKIGSVIEARQDRIANNLDMAQELTERAEQLMNECQNETKERRKQLERLLLHEEASLNAEFIKKIEEVKKKHGAMEKKTQKELEVFFDMLSPKIQALSCEIASLIAKKVLLTEESEYAQNQHGVNNANDKSHFLDSYFMACYQR